MTGTYEPNFAANGTLPSGYSEYDYSDATSSAAFTIEESASLTSTGVNLWTDYYSETTTQHASVTVGAYTQSGDVGSAVNSGYIPIPLVICTSRIRRTLPTTSRSAQTSRLTTTPKAQSVNM